MQLENYKESSVDLIYYYYFNETRRINMNIIFYTCAARILKFLEKPMKKA